MIKRIEEAQCRTGTTFSILADGSMKKTNAMDSSADDAATKRSEDAKSDEGDSDDVATKRSEYVRVW